MYRAVGGVFTETEDDASASAAVPPTQKARASLAERRHSARPTARHGMHSIRTTYLVPTYWYGYQHGYEEKLPSPNNP